MYNNLHDRDYCRSNSIALSFEQIELMFESENLMSATPVTVWCINNDDNGINYTQIKLLTTNQPNNQPPTNIMKMNGLLFMDI